MIFTLPSMGLLGCSEVEMSIPTYGHVRDISSQNIHGDVAGYEFVKSLLKDPTDLDRMTYNDKNFLLAIAVGSMHMNSILLKATCACKANVSAKYVLDSSKVDRLDESALPIVEKDWGDIKCNYHFLSATDEQSIVKWALDVSNSLDEYKVRYEEGFICKTFGYDVTEENLKKVFELPVEIYYSALLFREVTYHGYPDFIRTECSECKRPITLLIPFEQCITKWSSNDIVDEFMSVSKLVDYQSFINMTFPETFRMRQNLDTQG